MSHELIYGSRLLTVAMVEVYGFSYYSFNELKIIFGKSIQNINLSFAWQFVQSTKFMKPKGISIIITIIIVLVLIVVGICFQTIKFKVQINHLTNDE